MQSSAGVIAIAIAGCSCSGKTMVTREMITSDEHSLVIHQDDYYKLVPPKTEDGLENWDVLEALDVDKLMHDVKAVVKNPLQHCSTCVAATAAITSREHKRHTVYIEGTMILDISMISELLQMKIFITLDYDTCLKRRWERRRDDVVDPPGFFDGCVWPMYKRREEKSLKDPSVNVIDGHQSKEQIMDVIRKLVKEQV